MPKTYILHDNNAEKLSTNCKKKYCPINNWLTYPFFILNKFIDFSDFI